MEVLLRSEIGFCAIRSFKITQIRRDGLDLRFGQAMRDRCMMAELSGFAVS